jgi:hypothetical protein
MRKTKGTNKTPWRKNFKKLVFAEVLKKFCLLWKLRVKYLVNCEVVVEAWRLSGAVTVIQE